MARDLISNMVNRFFKSRFEEIEDYRLNVSDIQNEQLFDLIRLAENTEWGKKYDFRTISSYQDFRERLPIMDSEKIRPYIDRTANGENNILWPGLPKKILNSFADSRIPVSDLAINETFLKGKCDSYIIYLNNNPESKLFSGYFVTVGIKGEPQFINEIACLVRENESFPSSLFNLPKQVKKGEITKPSDQLAMEISTEQVSCFRGSPESLSELISKSYDLKDKDGNIPFMKNAEILFHLTSSRTEEIETRIKSLDIGIDIQSSYCSPEGFIGIQDNLNDNSFLLMIDICNFYEFLPVGSPDVQPVPLEDTKVGIDYQLLITNCSGLWRYLSGGPALRFVSKNPYRFILV